MLESDLSYATLGISLFLWKYVHYRSLRCVLGFDLFCEFAKLQVPPPTWNLVFPRDILGRLGPPNGNFGTPNC